MYFKISITLILIFFISCQPVELLEPVNIDTSKLEKISINSKEVNVDIKYNPIFSENNLEDRISNPPIKLINKWIKENISNFGKENKFSINVIDASILRNEIKNNDAKKFEEKNIYKYDVFILVEYELYDDNNFLIANASVEIIRSTTSQKYISINESELIINNLVNESLKDFAYESKLTLKNYMNEYLK